MGWETRRGKRVYYRKVREGGRVRSIYCGSGARGEQAARADAERRACATSAPVAPPPKLQQLKKEPAGWPSVLDIIRVRPNYATLLARYPAEHLPGPRESLDDWARRRQRALAAQGAGRVNLK